MENDPETFGDYLKSLREEFGFTLNELAEETGYSDAYLSQIEKGRRKNPPTIDMLKDLSYPLETPYSELLRKAGYNELADGQYYKELFSNINSRKVDNASEDNKELKQITELMNLHFSGVVEWTNDECFSNSDTICMRENLNQLLLGYKDAVEKLSVAKQKWDSKGKSLVQLWNDSATEEEIKQMFFNFELDDKIADLIKVIENFSTILTDKRA